MANVVVTGGVNNGGDIRRNAQFKVTPGDRLCIVAWVRSTPEPVGGSWAGPYLGINYTGAHGIVDAGHNHGTHWVIGPPPFDHDTAPDMNWPLTRRQSYPNLAKIIQDGKWHRYKTDFVVGTNPYDTADQRRFSPELGAGQSWTTTDTNVYGQPRVSLFGKPGNGTAAFPYTRNDVAEVEVTRDADFGDIYFYRADAAPELACPPDAELDAIPWASDHVICGGTRTCMGAVVPVPAFSAPAGPLAAAGNMAYTCLGCNAAFGAAPGVQTCAETTPFCLNPAAPKGGDCAACTNDNGAALDAKTRCSAATPLCKPDGGCGKCALDGDCVNAGPEIVHPGPSCNGATGQCFTCLGDNGVGDPAGACTPGRPRCDDATGLCGVCATNDDCKDPAGKKVHGGPFCDVGSGACLTCASDFGAKVGPTTCPQATPHCDVAAAVAGICGKCAKNADCVNAAGATTHVGPICDPTKGLCAKCDGDQEVSQGPYGCKSDTPTCFVEGRCAKCTADADCVNPPGVRLHAKASCNKGTGACEGAPAEVPAADGTRRTRTIGGEEIEEGGCGCTVPGVSSRAAPIGLLGIAFGLVAVRVRRRSR